MTLDELLRQARAEGVTMIILDGHRAGCWHKHQKRYFVAYDADPAAALRAALTAATQDPDILI